MKDVTAATAYGHRAHGHNTQNAETEQHSAHYTVGKYHNWTVVNRSVETITEASVHKVDDDESECI